MGWAEVQVWVYENVTAERCSVLSAGFSGEIKYAILPGGSRSIRVIRSRYEDIWTRVLPF